MSSGEKAFGCRLLSASVPLEKGRSNTAATGWVRFSGFHPSRSMSSRCIWGRQTGFPACQNWMVCWAAGSVAELQTFHLGFSC